MNCVHTKHTNFTQFYSYHWRRTHCKRNHIEHATLCTPKGLTCKSGFQWIPDFKTNACFHLSFTKVTSTSQITTQFSLERYCSSLDARLAAPRDVTDVKALQAWLRVQAMNRG